jgi:hypothetical protein
MSKADRDAGAARGAAAEVIGARRGAHARADTGASARGRAGSRRGRARDADAYAFARGGVCEPWYAYQLLLTRVSAVTHDRSSRPLPSSRAFHFVGAVAAGAARSTLAAAGKRDQALDRSQLARAPPRSRAGAVRKVTNPPAAQDAAYGLRANTQFGDEIHQPRWGSICGNKHQAASLDIA